MSTVRGQSIAAVFHVEEANARQLATRARQHVADGQRACVSDAEQANLTMSVMTP
jgi:hypothetical protein